MVTEATADRDVNEVNHEEPSTEDTLQAQHYNAIRYLAKGSAISLAGKMVTKTTRLATTPILAWLLGASGFGIYCLAEGCMNTVTLILTSALSLSTIRQVALHDSRGEPAKAEGTAALVTVVSVIGSVLITIVVVAGAPWIAGRVFHKPELVLPLQVAFLALPLTWVGFNLGAACIGRRKVIYREASWSGFRVGILATAVLLVLTAGRDTAPATKAFYASFGFLVGALVSFVAGVVGTRRCFPKLRLGAWREAEVGEFARTVFPFLLSHLCIFGLARLNILLSGVWLSSADVAVFGAIAMVTTVDSFGAMVIGDVLQPTVAHLHDRGQLAELQRIYLTTTRWLHHLAVPGIILLAAKAHSILTLLGPGFGVGTVPMQVMCLGALINASVGNAVQVLAMSDRQWLLASNRVASVVVNVVLCVTLVYVLKLGILGFAISTACAIATLAVSAAVEVQKLFGLRNFTLRNSKALFSAVLASPVLLISSASPWADIGLGIGLYYAAYIILNLAFGLEPDDQLVVRQIRTRLMGPRRGSTVAQSKNF